MLGNRGEVGARRKFKQKKRRRGGTERGLIYIKKEQGTSRGEERKTRKKAGRKSGLFIFIKCFGSEQCPASGMRTRKRGY